MTPLVEELIPCPDPWDVARKLAHLPHLLFLDSADPPPERSRYSYVTADPIEWYGYEEDPNALERPRYSLIDPLSHFSHDFAHCRVELSGHRLPFSGGYAGLFAYDLNRRLEVIPRPQACDFPT